MNVRSLFTLLCTLFLTSCGTVTVKQIAGDSVPEQAVADLCTGSWRGAGTATAVFRMKDVDKGIVELHLREPDGTLDKTHFAVRTLGERLVMTERGKDQENGDPGIFLRLALTPAHAAFFMPDSEALKEAVKKNRIPGTITEREMPRNPDSKVKPQKVESVVLDRFGLAEAEKMGGVRNCFDSDPLLVLVRDVGPRLEKAAPDGKSKKPEPAPARTGAGKRR